MGPLTGRGGEPREWGWWINDLPSVPSRRFQREADTLPDDFIISASAMQPCFGNEPQRYRFRENVPVQDDLMVKMTDGNCTSTVRLTNGSYGWLSNSTTQ